jgi:GDSL-like Lipase/Acylhydrolase family
MNPRVRLLLLALSLLVIASAATPADAQHGPYLALGDSVPFGFITQAGFEYINADNFIGFPKYIGQELRFQTTNAACPGETTSSFLSSVGADNGCRFFRSQAPLHVPYGSTQLDFALAFLRGHPQTRLVTVHLGADDLLLLEHACAGDPSCMASGLPQVLAATISTNMQTILSDIREAGFKGVIVVVNYYSVDYSDAAGTQLTQLLNQAVAAPVAGQGVVVADVFTSFRAAASSAFAGGNTCRAGLLNALPPNEFTCDFHPSQSGQGLISRTVEGAYKSAIQNRN